MGARWVAMVTKVPAVTVVVVLLPSACMAIPIKDLALSLPDNGSAEAGSPQRITYDLIATEFGPGYNARCWSRPTSSRARTPRARSAVWPTTSPRSRASSRSPSRPRTRRRISAWCGSCPQWAQSDPRTTDLVERIRAQEATWEQQLKITDIAVTGQTAVAIDVSDQLSGALVPFGIVVVGLSLILLTIVFRSIAVPIKATLGYLLSIVAALGCGRRRVHVGLAGRAARHHLPRTAGQLPADHPDGRAVRAGDGLRGVPGLARCARTTSTPATRKHAIRTGFICSARVVTAAAVIMISVFAAFIPHGCSTIKPIALGLAVGRVRRRVPGPDDAGAGRAGAAREARPGGCPKRLDRALPTSTSRARPWSGTSSRSSGKRPTVPSPSGPRPPPSPPTAVRSRSTCRCRGGSTVSYDHPDPAVRAALVWTLGGWRKPVGGRLGVLGRVLPEEAGAVRKSVRVVPLPSREDDAVDVRRYVSTLLVAQSDKPWPSRRTTNQALDQAGAGCRRCGRNPTRSGWRTAGSATWLRWSAGSSPSAPRPSSPRS